MIGSFLNNEILNKLDCYQHSLWHLHLHHMSACVLFNKILFPKRSKSTKSFTPVLKKEMSMYININMKKIYGNFDLKWKLILLNTGVIFKLLMKIFISHIHIHVQELFLRFICVRLLKVRNLIHYKASAKKTCFRKRWNLCFPLFFSLFKNQYLSSDNGWQFLVLFEQNTGVDGCWSNHKMLLDKENIFTLWFKWHLLLTSPISYQSCSLQIHFLCALVGWMSMFKFKTDLWNNSL